MTNWIITAKLPEDGKNAQPFTMYVEADNLVKAAQKAQSYCKRANFDILSLSRIDGDIPAKADNITRK